MFIKMMALFVKIFPVKSRNHRPPGVSQWGVVQKTQRKKSISGLTLRQPSQELSLDFIVFTQIEEPPTDLVSD